MADDQGMLELRLTSGAVVAFDGRILEVLDRGPGRRFHVAQLGDPLVTEHADGSRTVVLDDPTVSVHFKRAEVPALNRLLVALASARGA